MKLAGRIFAILVTIAIVFCYQTKLYFTATYAVYVGDDPDMQSCLFIE